MKQPKQAQTRQYEPSQWNDVIAKVTPKRKVLVGVEDPDTHEWVRVKEAK